MKINTVSWKIKVHYMRILITYKWKKVYKNSFNGSFLIAHAILKNVVSRKRAIKFSDLPFASSAQATARNSTIKTIPKWTVEFCDNILW